VGRPCMAGRRRACGERRAGRVRGRPLGDELDERRRGASVALDAVTPERVLAAAHIKARLVRPVLVSYSDTQAGRSLLVSMLVRQRMPSVGAVASWFRIRGPRRHRSFPWRLLRKGARRERWRFRGSVSAETSARQPVAGAVVCRQSLRRLPVAVIRRHSLRTAALPRRKKRSARRLNFVSPKTGSIMCWRRL
jgi:hypothetical protein